MPVGTDFLLTTDETFNESTLGTSSPQLRRSSQNCMFPYEIPGTVSIKNSTFNTERYYYFYNWEVGYYSHECVSERIPVTVVVQAPSGVAPLPAWASGLRIFPNPTPGLINIDIQGFTGGELIAAIKNTHGQTIRTHQVNAAAGNASFSMDLSHFTAGIYWLELACEGGTAQSKVVVR